VNKNDTTFLASADGRKLLQAVAEIPGDSIAKQMKLRRDYPADRVRAALTLSDLRERAQSKFARADEMFFDRDGLEQASGDVIASHRAKRYASFDCVADLCSGVGGDSAALARDTNLTSVDIRPSRVAMTRLNVEAYGQSTRVACSDVRHWRPPCDALFIDPSRRESGRRVIKLSNYAPSIDDVSWLAPTLAIGIKVAPGISHDEIPAGSEVEFISVNGECREAVIWMGALKSHAEVRATLLPGGESLVRDVVDPVGCSPVSEYLYEPDRAVIRAHLIEQIATEIGAQKLDPEVAYLTADRLHETPFARPYKVLDSFPFSVKRAQAYVDAHSVGILEIKKRRFPMTPDEVRKKLKLKGSEKMTLILTRIGDDATAIFCDRAVR
jgi:hypothetical protein